MKKKSIQELLVAAGDQIMFIYGAASVYFPYVVKASGAAILLFFVYAMIR